MAYYTHDNLEFTLVGGISSTATSGIRFTVKYKATGVAVTPDTRIEILTIDKDNENYEHIHFTGFTENSTGDITLTGVTRGLGLSGTSIAEVSANRKAHVSGAIAGITANHFLHSRAAAVFAGDDSTGSNTIKIGDATAAEQSLVFDQGRSGAEENPKLSTNAAGDSAIYTDKDGNQTVLGAGVGTISGGDGIVNVVTASDNAISVDLGTDSGLEFVSNKLEAKVTGAITKGSSGLDIDESGLDYASQAEMEAGTATDKPANAEGVKQAIDAQRPNFFIAPSDVIIAESNSEVSKTADSTYTKAKEIQVPHNGGYRAKWQIKNLVQNTGISYSRVYVNGVAVSTEYQSNSSFYSDISYDLSSLSSGDLVQIYYKNNSDSSGGVFVRNFSISASCAPSGAIVNL